MAFKANGVVIVSDTRDLTITTDTIMTRGSGNVFVTSTGLTGSGYSIGGNKVFATDGSAFANVVFDNSSFLEWPTPFTPQMGTISGYTSGGLTTTPATARVNTIDKFPFSSDTSAGDVGDLTQARECTSGQSSSTFGYSSAGSTPPTVDTIDKFPFSSDTNASDVGELTRAAAITAGQSSQTFGYDSGGLGIDKFPFAADSPATDVGNLLASVSFLRAGQSSSQCGYATGGFISPAAIDTIQKFSFSTDGNSVDVGEITDGRYSAAGQSSQTHGYTSGGQPVTVDTIDKFTFSSDASSTDVGELTSALSVATGQNSLVSGYTSGGNPVKDTIQKFPFSSDTSASDVGELTQARRGSAGQQSGGNSGI